jgi:hypothetical protein
MQQSPVSKQNRRAAPARTTRALVRALAGAVALAPMSSGSAMPDVSVFASAKEISDEALGAMRGRYVAGNHVVQFGVQMVTTWETAAGETLRAGADMLVADLHTATPTVQYVPTVSVTVPVQPAAPDPAPQVVQTVTHAAAVSTPAETVSASAATVVSTPGPAASSSPSIATPPPAATSVVTPGAGVNSVTGVVQSIQVAGDQNVVTQSTAVSVSSAAIAPLKSATTPLTGPDTRTIVAPSGSTVTVTLEPKSMLVQVSVPNQGIVMQQIRGRDAALNAPSLLQAARIAGDLQIVQSTLALRVQMLPRAAGTIPIPLSLLQGIRPAGAF